MTNKLKDFTSNYNNFKNTYGFKKINPLYIFGTTFIINIVWIFLIIGYFNKQSIKFSVLTPFELGNIISVSLIPICLTWIIAFYINKAFNYNYEEKIIFPFLQSIMDPYGDNATIINSIKNKLQTETNELKTTLDSFKEFSDKVENIYTQISENIKLNTTYMENHKDVLNSITTKLNQSINDIETLNNTTNIVEEKTNIITNTLTDRTRALETSINRLNQSKTDIENSVNKAITISNDISNNFTTAGNKIISSTEIANTHATQILNKIDEKTKEFINKSNTSAERIANVSNDLTSSINTINIISNENKKLARDALEKLSLHSQVITTKLNEQTKRFEDNSGTILNTVSNVENKFNNITNVMNAISETIISNFKEIGSEINLQKDKLFETSSEVAENITDLSNKIINEKDNFIKSIEEVKTTSDDATTSLKHSSTEIINTSDNIKSATKEINDLMTKSKTNLASQAEASLKFATEIKNTLKNQINDLEVIVNSVSTQTKLGEISIEKQGEKLTSLTEDLFLKIDTMNGKISSTINNILNLSTQIDEKFKTMNNSILQNSSTASKIISENINDTINQSNNFKQLSSEFSTQTKNINNEITTLINELKQQTITLDTTTNKTKDLIGNISADIIKMTGIIPQINNSMNGLENTIKTNINNINSSIDNTKEKSSALIENLNIVGAKFSKFATEKTSELEYISNNSTQAITKIANYTSQLTKELQTNLEKLSSHQTTQTKASISSSDTFLNDAGYIIEKLNSIAIDLSQILSPDVSNELWNKYNAGYKSVFSKYLNHILNKKQITSLKELLDTNKDFKQYTDNYIKEFDNLILKASTTDKREILLATITSTDIGKAYMVLKELK